MHAISHKKQQNVQTAYIRFSFVLNVSSAFVEMRDIFSYAVLVILLLQYRDSADN